jgi:hypothetical protein
LSRSSSNIALHRANEMGPSFETAPLFLTGISEKR